MITGSGMISAGPGYRHTVLDGKAFVDASAALSWLSYQMAQARFEFPDLANGRLTLGSQVMYQDAMQVNYFGIGNDALAVQSQYRLRTTDVAGYAEVEVAEGLSIGGEVGWLKRPQVLATAGSFNSHYPAAQAAYPADPGMSAAFQPNFIRAELSLTANTLDSRSHPTEGRLYRSAVTTYKDQSAGTFSFDQYEAEAVQMVPVVGKRLLLGLHAWTVFTDVPAGHQVPFYLMPAIGGNNTLRAFDDYRFHDQNTLVATAELRLALLTHVDLAGFVDAGNAAEHYSNLNFKKTSVGVGVRMHTQRATFGRVDVAHGSEGWAFVVRTNDPFKLSRVTRKLSSVPFMP
jgi:outer membrane protein assembly factor BamA